MAGAVSGSSDRKGRISDRDIAAIREQVRIEDVVGDYVQLRRAGADSMKGLCPFHDEKSPSFHVRPNHGHFHCFGCGEGGDVYAFIQKIEHVSFVEAVEMLADRIGYTVTYSGGGTSVQRDRGSRSRLIAANAAAQEFYAAALESEEAAPARKYLTERNFDAAAARQFGCGFAPSGWDSLTKHLIRKGFRVQGTRSRRAVPGGQARPDGPLPPQAAVADPQRQRRDRRLRRAPDFRRRPDGSQVRQHPGDRAVQEVQRACSASIWPSGISPRGIRPWWSRATPT